MCIAIVETLLVFDQSFSHFCNHSTVMALNGISFPPTSSTITKVHLKNCIVPILSSLFNSSIFALMTLFRVSPVAFPKRKLSVLKENIPFSASASTFIRTKEKQLSMACLIFLYSNDLLPGSLFHSSFVIQMPMESYFGLF